MSQTLTLAVASKMLSMLGIDRFYLNRLLLRSTLPKRALKALVQDRALKALAHQKIALKALVQAKRAVKALAL
jgi:hypothetical protein